MKKNCEGREKKRKRYYFFFFKPLPFHRKGQLFPSSWEKFFGGAPFGYILMRIYDRKTPLFTIFTSSMGRSFSPVLFSSIILATLMPLSTLPNTTWWPSSHEFFSI
jgi:hypothetical protein